jgi:hypothetical protein
MKLFKCLLVGMGTIMTIHWIAGGNFQRGEELAIHVFLGLIISASLRLLVFAKDQLQP